ncbi:hypothetical protein M758_4G029900 [Ceratodon purpureus]|uniref:RAB6-interacting golgin n=1 Tax=Ceratodon purpureus TaxID=3225 RepID=A0A8T0I4R1_CERPU|nr:hypothetical protein KC19_4G033700 [Ceratodon purpureus]KAG0617982.1 hypothetical protein M758_4G029900 [Ceratodon purpureus]
MAMMAEVSVGSLEQSLRETLHKEAEESERRQKAAEIQKLVWEERRSVISASLPPHLSGGTAPGEQAKQDSDSAVKIVHAKEQEIEKRKLQVREKVQAQLNRVNNEARSLDQLRKELEGLEDPTKQEVADIRKKIEVVDRELRPIKQLCEKKEKELKDALETYNEKSKIKTDLVGRLMDIVTESERQRMHKLEELNRLLEEMGRSKGFT